MKTLFNGIIREDVDFDPIFEMADELFTHLGIACTFLLPSISESDAFHNNFSHCSEPGRSQIGDGHTLFS